MKYIQSTLLICFVLACKSEVDIKSDLPPSAVVVSSKLAPNGKDIILNWTKSIDPEGKEVTYSVFLKDTLINNYKDTSFVISGLAFGVNYTGSVIATDISNKKIFTTFSIQTESEFVKIPDTNFERILINYKYDDLKDGQILRENAIKIKEIFLGPNGSSMVSSLSGIESMIELSYLDCGESFLSNLNVSKNVKLKTLRCYYNKFSSLDISQNLLLEQLDCDNNELSSLDISKNTNLKFLNCSTNNLKEIILSKNLVLESINISNNKLTSFDVSKNKELKSLICFNSNLNEINISKNLKLESLYCGRNELKSLNLTENIEMKWLWCEENKFKSLDISKNLKLKEFYPFSETLEYVCVNNLNQALNTTSRHLFRVCN